MEGLPKVVGQHLSAISLYFPLVRGGIKLIIKIKNYTMSILKNKLIIISIIFVVLVLGLYFSGFNRGDLFNFNKNKGDSQENTLDKFFTLKVVKTDLSPELNEKYRNEMTVYKDIVLGSPEKFNLNAFMDAAMVKYTVSDYDGARDLWLYVNQVRPSSSPSFYNLGNLYADIYKNCTEAEKYFKIAMANDPNELGYLRSIFDFYNTKCSNKQLAEEILKKALILKDDSADFMVLSAEFYRDQGNREEAIKYYEQAIKLSPQNQALKDEYNKFKSGF